MSRRVAAALTAALVLLSAALALIPATALAATPRTSLTAVEPAVMCVSCREPLALAQSPQAIAERGYIQMLVAQGYTEKQVIRALVAQYGTAVLAEPPAKGFNLAVYILPPAVVALGLVILLITLPRWRRRAREAAPLPQGRALDPSDARRLEEDLARYDG